MYILLTAKRFYEVMKRCITGISRREKMYFKLDKILHATTRMGRMTIVK